MLVPGAVQTEKRLIELQLSWRLQISLSLRALVVRCINVEVLCSPPNVKNYLGAIHCPIFLKHVHPAAFAETFARERPEFVWQDRTGCSVSEQANAKLSYATVSSKYSVASPAVSLEGEGKPSLFEASFGIDSPVILRPRDNPIG
ncbi:unnamed protein product [Dibothriocephalus latus]|uniref:Uncharacterized protein n=1 Tax=Dibothriocephalus latus TaxID=60516 RepID=A0A3P7P567_DIBLA|nr:unnamed protein product [Dibothriocephalus latus]